MSEKFDQSEFDDDTQFLSSRDNDHHDNSSPILTSSPSAPSPTHPLPCSLSLPHHLSLQQQSNQLSLSTTPSSHTPTPYQHSQHTHQQQYHNNENTVAFHLPNTDTFENSSLENSSSIQRVPTPIASIPTFFPPQSQTPSPSPKQHHFDSIHSPTSKQTQTQLYQSPSAAISQSLSQYSAGEEDVQPTPVDPKSCLFCPLCFDLFLDPISLPCGHTYCRSCILRAVEVKRRCPYCIAPLPQQHLDLHSAPQNFTIATLLQTYWAKAYANRLNNAIDVIHRKPVREKYGIFITDYPFYPIRNVSLLVFEPRYRVLMNNISNSHQKFLCLSYPNSQRAVRNLPPINIPPFLLGVEKLPSRPWYSFFSGFLFGTTSIMRSDHLMNLFNYNYFPIIDENIYPIEYEKWTTNNITYQSYNPPRIMCPHYYSQSNDQQEQCSSYAHSKNSTLPTAAAQIASTATDSLNNSLDDNTNNSDGVVDAEGIQFPINSPRHHQNQNQTHPNHHNIPSPNISTTELDPNVNNTAHYGYFPTEPLYRMSNLCELISLAYYPPHHALPQKTGPAFSTGLFPNQQAKPGQITTQLQHHLHQQHSSQQYYHRKFLQHCTEHQQKCTCQCQNHLNGQTNIPSQHQHQHEQGQEQDTQSPHLETTSSHVLQTSSTSNPSSSPQQQHQQHQQQPPPTPQQSQNTINRQYSYQYPAFLMTLTSLYSYVDGRLLVEIAAKPKRVLVDSVTVEQYNLFTGCYTDAATLRPAPNNNTFIFNLNYDANPPMIDFQSLLATPPRLPNEFEFPVGTPLGSHISQSRTPSGALSSRLFHFNTHAQTITTTASASSTPRQSTQSFPSMFTAASSHTNHVHSLPPYQNMYNSTGHQSFRSTIRTIDEELSNASSTTSSTYTNNNNNNSSNITPQDDTTFKTASREAGISTTVPSEVTPRNINSNTSNANADELSSVRSRHHSISPTQTQTQTQTNPSFLASNHTFYEPSLTISPFQATKHNIITSYQTLRTITSNVSEQRPFNATVQAILFPQTYPQQQHEFSATDTYPYQHINDSNTTINPSPMPTMQLTKNKSNSSFDQRFHTHQLQTQLQHTPTSYIPAIDFKTHQNHNSEILHHTSPFSTLYHHGAIARSSTNSSNSSLSSPDHPQNRENTPLNQRDIMLKDNNSNCQSNDAHQNKDPLTILHFTDPHDLLPFVRDIIDCYCTAFHTSISNLEVRYGKIPIPTLFTQNTNLGEGTSSNFSFSNSRSNLEQPSPTVSTRSISANALGSPPSTPHPPQPHVYPLTAQQYQQQREQELSELFQQLDELSFWLMQLLPHTPTGTIATTAPTTSLPGIFNPDTTPPTPTHNTNNNNNNNNVNDTNEPVFPFTNSTAPSLTSPGINSNASFMDPNGLSFSTTVTNMLLHQQQQQYRGNVQELDNQHGGHIGLFSNTNSTNNTAKAFKPDYPTRKNGFVARPGSSEWFLQNRELLISIHHPIYRIQFVCLLIQHSIKQKVQQRVYVGLIFTIIIVFFCLLRMTAFGLFPTTVVTPSSTNLSLQSSSSLSSSSNTPQNPFQNFDRSEKNGFHNDDSFPLELD